MKYVKRYMGMFVLMTSTVALAGCGTKSQIESSNKTAVASTKETKNQNGVYPKLTKYTDVKEINALKQKLNQLQKEEMNRTVERNQFDYRTKSEEILDKKLKIDEKDISRNLSDDHKYKLVSYDTEGKQYLIDMEKDEYVCIDEIAEGSAWYVNFVGDHDIRFLVLDDKDKNEESYADYKMYSPDTKKATTVFKHLLVKNIQNDMYINENGTLDFLNWKAKTMLHTDWKCEDWAEGPSVNQFYNQKENKCLIVKNLTDVSASQEQNVNLEVYYIALTKGTAQPVENIDMTDSVEDATIDFCNLFWSDMDTVTMLYNHQAVSYCFD